MLNTVFFFGCDGRAGHYLKAAVRDAIPREEYVWEDRMTHLDGSLAPDKKGSQDECVAQAWRLTGFTPVPYSALSWWDRSVDKRLGSNIILFAPGHTVSSEDILSLGRKFFSHIPSLKRDIVILPDWLERTYSK